MRHVRRDALGTCESNLSTQDPPIGKKVELNPPFTEGCASPYGRDPHSAGQLNHLTIRYLITVAIGIQDQTFQRAFEDGLAAQIPSNSGKLEGGFSHLHLAHFLVHGRQDKSAGQPKEQKHYQKLQEREAPGIESQRETILLSHSAVNFPLIRPNS